MFCWVPGHVGLPGSEAAYAADKQAATDRSLLCGQAPATNICTYLYQDIYSAWQDKWTDTQTNKLLDVKPTVQVW